MYRYNKLLAGASWVAEYGDPETSDWENYLYKYSAYHNLRAPRSANISAITHWQDTVPEAALNHPYPPFFMSTSTRDDRVHPYHARCFVKRLEEVCKLHFYMLWICFASMFYAYLIVLYIARG